MIRRGRQNASTRGKTPYDRPELRAGEPGFIGSIKSAAFGFLGLFSGVTDETNGAGESQHQQHYSSGEETNEDIEFIPARVSSQQDDDSSTSESEEEDASVIEYRGVKLTMADTTCKELRQLLHDSDLPTKGCKRELLERLKEYATTHPRPSRSKTEVESKEFAAPKSPSKTPTPQRTRRSPYAKHISFEEEGDKGFGFKFAKKEKKVMLPSRREVAPEVLDQLPNGTVDQETQSEFEMSDPNVPVSQWYSADDAETELPQDYYPGKFSANPHARRAYHPGRHSLASFSDSVPSARKRVREESNRVVSTSKYANQSLDTYTGTPSSRPRNSRCPRPSRFLTGRRDFQPISQTKNPTEAAKKIFEALNEMATPLERERKKPVATPSLAWAKYGKMIETEDSTGPLVGEVPPPRNSMPKIPFQTPQPKVQIVSPVKESTPQQTSPQENQYTPAPKQPVAVQSVPAKHKSPYQFTPAPKRMKPSTARKPQELKYLFSPPPSKGRAPPIRPIAEEPTPPAAAEGVPKAFSFMPKSTTPQKVDVTPPPAKQSTTTAPDAPPMNSSNPLFKFVTQDDSKWKCATCAVSNPNNLSKCPCCETDRPSDTKKTPEPAAKVASFLDTKAPAATTGFTFSLPNQPAAAAETSSGFSFKAPVAAAPEESTNQFKATVPAETGATQGGFQFGGPSATADSAAKPPANGFQFGLTAATSSKKEEEKPATGFQFSTPAVTETKPAAKPTTGFSFGGSATSAAPKESETKAVAGFEFGKEKKGDAFSFGSKVETPAPVGFGSTTPSIPKDKSVGGFSFGGPTTETKVEDPKPSTTGFSFGGTPAKPKDETKPAAAPSFSFGGSTAESKDETKPTTTGFSFGGTPAKPKDETKPTTTGFAFGGTPAKPKDETKPAAVPSFQFGGSTAESKDETKPGAPAFAFGATASAPVVNSTNAAPSFSFGGTSSGPKDDVPKQAAGFTFNSASAPVQDINTTKPSGQFQFGSSKPVETNAAAPSFGTAPSNGTMNQPSNAFSFGSSAPTPTAAPAGTSFGFSNPFNNASNAFNSSTPATAAAVNPNPFGGANQQNNSGMDTAAGQQPFGFQQPAPAAGMAAAPGGSTPFSFGGAQPSQFGMTPAPTGSFGGPAQQQPSSGAFSIGSAPVKKTRRIVKARRSRVNR